MKRIQFDSERVWEVEEFDGNVQMVDEHDVLYTLEWREEGAIYGAEVHQEYFDIVDDEYGVE